MFSNIFQKAALLGASTVASVALTGMMASSAQAATMSSYTSNFSVSLNSLSSELATGDFSFTKTEQDTGFFSYELTDFNASVNASVNTVFGIFNFSESLTFNDVTTNPNLFQAINQAFVPDKYQGILPNVLADKDFDYIGDGDFGEENLNFTFGFDLGDDNFQADNFDFVFNSEDLNNAATLVSDITGVNPGLAKPFLSGGGEISLTTTLVSQSNSNLVSASVPEPTTVFGIGIVGVGLFATRRKRAIKKIKQKAAA
ncbi:MAG: PEP-CTERM sorting domain-containing protein [Rivularia sp. (in: cyanobacteria)]